MSWRNLRSISSDPLSHNIFKMSQDQILFEARQTAPTTRTFRRLGAMFSSSLELTELGTFNKVRPTNRQFFAPLEPDKDRLRLWVKFDSAGRELFDYSYFGHTITNLGYLDAVPITQTNFDDGIVGGKIATEYNRTVEPEEKLDHYTKVSDSTNIRLQDHITNNIYNAFCITMFVRPMHVFRHLSEGELYDRYLYMKIDDTAGNYGYAARLGNDGDLYVAFKRAGTQHRRKVDNFIGVTSQGDFNVADFHPSDFIEIDVPGGFYERRFPDTNLNNFFIRLDIIYKFADNSITIRKDGVNQTTASDSSDMKFPSTPSTHTRDLLINRGRDDNSDPNFPAGIGKNQFADFRIYVGELTQTESTNLFNNFYSISSIAKGNVAIAGFSTLSINA